MNFKIPSILYENDDDSCDAIDVVCEYSTLQNEERNFGFTKIIYSVMTLVLS